MGRDRIVYLYILGYGLAGSVGETLAVGINLIMHSDLLRKLGELGPGAMDTYVRPLLLCPEGISVETCLSRGENTEQ